jgi:hypothetical protein
MKRFVRSRRLGLHACCTHSTSKVTSKAADLRVARSSACIAPFFNPEQSKECPYVAVGQGPPWQRRLELRRSGASSRWPLVSSGRWAGPASKRRSLLAPSSMAKRGADEMADRYPIENREAAVGVQMFRTCGSAGGLRCGGRKRRSSLVGRSVLHPGVGRG